MKLDRLIGILSILLQQDKATMPELAKPFEVPRRTISRDIDVLARAGIPISATQGAGGGVSIMSGYRIDRTLLTSSELQAILAGLRSLDSVSNTNRYGQLMEKLAGPNILASGRILIDLAAWHKQPLSHKIELLQSAISKGQTIAFHYYSPSGETDRIVEPYYIVFQWGAWYLWGWCQIRGDYRLFKLDRMSRLAFGQPFSSRPASYPNLSDDHVFPTRYQVEAIVPAKYKWKLVENYGESCFTPEPDGSCRFSIGFTHLDNAVSWLLSFQGEAQLLGPEELKASLHQLGEKLIKTYGGT